MENTLENKAKFFAQYWGQKVLHRQHLVNGNLIDLVYNKDTKDKYWLGLKPLSSITDEDAIILMNIIYPEFDKKEILYKKDRFIYFLSKNPIYHISMECVEDNCIYVFDYLRSKAYAIPWMGLSVDELIEYGWVKLEDK